MASNDGDLASFALRMGLGPMLVAHGANKAFGAGGFEGTTGWFDSLGLQPAWLHARLAAATEIGAGAAITLGLLSPLPSAAAVGLMATAAATDHRGKGFFVFKGGWEYTAIVGVASVALATLGSGRYSLDHALGHRRSGKRAGMFALAVGVASAAGLLAATYRPGPASDPEPTATEAEPTATDPEHDR